MANVLDHNNRGGSGTRRQRSNTCVPQRPVSTLLTRRLIGRRIISAVFFFEIGQLVDLLDRMHTPDERLLLVLTCCARLTDAVEAEDQGLFKDLECAIDPLNLKRCAWGGRGGGGLISPRLST